MCPLPYVLLSLSRILVTQSQRPFQVSFGEDIGYGRGELDRRIGLVASIVVISFPDRFPKAVNVVAIVAQKGPVYATFCHCQAAGEQMFCYVYSLRLHTHMVVVLILIFGGWNGFAPHK